MKKQDGPCKNKPHSLWPCSEMPVEAAMVVASVGQRGGRKPCEATRPTNHSQTSGEVR
jgi:hypothetical protein